MRLACSLDEVWRLLDIPMCPHPDVKSYSDILKVEGSEGRLLSEASNKFDSGCYSGVVRPFISCLQEYNNIKHSWKTSSIR